jgi:hypothetical protein
MAPSAPRPSCQSVKNVSELVPLLRDGSEQPQKKSTRYGAHAYANIATSNTPVLPQTIRMRTRNIYHGAQVTLLVEPPNNRGRINYHNRMRQVRKAPATGAVRLDWMRRLRPKLHRRI